MCFETSLILFDIPVVYREQAPTEAIFFHSSYPSPLAKALEKATKDWGTGLRIEREAADAADPRLQIFAWQF